MSILNETLSFLPDQWAKEFVGDIEKQLIPAGTQLRKRVTKQVEFSRVSPWWMLKKDWDTQRQRATAMGVNPADVARARQAVRTDWQANLEQVVYGQLILPVYGWTGQVRWQPVNSMNPKVVLIGGGMQVCIPNLTTQHVRVLHSVPHA